MILHLLCTVNKLFQCRHQNSPIFVAAAHSMGLKGHSLQAMSNLRDCRDKGKSRRQS